MAMRERFNEPLIDPTWEEVVERDPLVAFSHYLCGRVHALPSVADEITDNLDHGFLNDRVDGSRIGRAETLMWLWTLGAYEVVRTMCQARECFSKNAVDQLSQLKKTLSVIRMPAAKMEKPGRKLPVSSSRSPTGWDVSKRDLLVNDPDDSGLVYAREILLQFDQVFSSINKTDVLGAHEGSY